MYKILFIGEEPSKTARERGWKWGDEQLCSKTLLEALDSAKVPRNHCIFENLFQDDVVRPEVLARLQKTRLPIVAMGKKVQRVLSNHKIKFVPLVHPAARGKIRKTALYQQHVLDTIGGIYAAKSKNNQRQKTDRTLKEKDYTQKVTCRSSPKRESDSRRDSQGDFHANHRRDSSHDPSSYAR